MSVPATPAVVQYKGKQNKMQKLARTQVKRNKMQKLARAQGKQECKIVTIVHEFAMRTGSSIHMSSSTLRTVGRTQLAMIRRRTWPPASRTGDIRNTMYHTSFE